MPKISNGKEVTLPPPPTSKNSLDSREKPAPAVSRVEEVDIFVGDGVDYDIPSKDMSQSPISEDMEESPRHKDRVSYFSEPAYGPVPPSQPHDWQLGNEYDAMQAQALAGAYQGEWQEHQYSDQLAYSEQYLQQLNIPQDPRFMTQEQKDRGLGSVFKRDDQRLQQLREKDAREKDPNFISESYSECYPGYQGITVRSWTVMMKMICQKWTWVEGWDFETQEEWATYNEQKEVMPKAAFQFGVKMQDGRKTRKQNKDQKLANEPHKINKILARSKAESEMNDDGGQYDDYSPGKKLRI
ncbi:Protein RED, C-terminal [Dillenia turbinata]|uniref:Protein RED, C-terminal n=1 Tax=Dillenia turbinata TaxID=194707 RepID=A0AAN8W3M6_9MAGN